MNKIDKEKITILACDDDIDIVNSIKLILRVEGYNVVTASNGREALEIVKGGGIDLVIMDVMMPEMDGVEATMEIRSAGYNIPILIVTAKGEPDERVLGLKAGANDYIVKPFYAPELLLRVEKLLDMIGIIVEPENPDKGIIRNGPIAIYDNAKRVEVNGTPVDLTPTEYSILKVFMVDDNLGVVMSPKEIYRKAWDEDPYGNEGTVLVHIRHIRQKIEIDPANPRFIVSVFGHGYKMERLG